MRYTAGDRIALLVPGSTLYVETVLGLLGLGVIPIPMDPSLTPSERQRLLDYLRPSFVVTDEDALAHVHEQVVTDADWRTPLARPMHLTSGTTGSPKGVYSGVLSPEAGQALVDEERALWGFNGDDVNLVLSPLHHSAPLRFAMGTLLAGGRLVIPGKFEPDAVTSAITMHRPTTMFCVPTHLQWLFAVWDAQAWPDLSSFRLVAHAGAACPPNVKERLIEAFPAGTTWEFYGSTEGQFTACRSEEWLQRPGTVGRARPGRVLSLDDDGVIWCAVPEHARFTYWETPEKTATAWRDTPHGPAFTAGDLGRLDDEGYLYLDGRREDLIISGGVNVYPAEVEAALSRVPGVNEIAVYGVPDEEWGMRVCAAVIGTASEQTLRDHAREHLAPAKRPKEYRFVSQFPLTATGKIKRLDLAETRATVAIQPEPVWAREVSLPWDAQVGDPVRVMAQARARHGDTFGVLSGPETYLFVFGQTGLASLYGLPEETASKGVADYLMLRRKLPPEIFDGRRVLPSGLFRKDDVQAYLAHLQTALDISLAEIEASQGDTLDVFQFGRILAHRMGVASWISPELATGPSFTRLVEAFDALDGAESFVHPDRMAAVAASDYATERTALDHITRVIAEATADRGHEADEETSLFARVCAAWQTEAEPQRSVGIAYDVALIHMASMSNLAAALGWMLVHVAQHQPSTADLQNPDWLRTFALESMRWSQRSLMARTVLQPCDVATEAGVFRLKPGTTLATLLPLTNTDPGHGLDQWRPDWWARHRFTGPETGSGPNLGVTAFGHGKHSCPAQPFALEAMTSAVRRLTQRWRLSPSWDQAPQPVAAQIGGVARAELPCLVRLNPPA